MRKFLDFLYAASLWLAALSMVGVLVMVLLSITSRLFNFSASGSDAYAGYAMAGAGFLALAGTLKNGEHIRVTLLLGALKGKARKAAEVFALLIASVIAGFLAFYSIRLVGESLKFNDISTGIDATPMWIPQLLMAAGTSVLFIAFIDELVMELLGKRKTPSDEERHHE